MSAHAADTEALLTPSEVATLFRVDPKTVTRWAKAGQAVVDPHARRPPPLPRVRGAGPAHGVPQQRAADALNPTAQPGRGRATQPT